jgi:hypothetical protein
VRGWLEAPNLKKSGSVPCGYRARGTKCGVLRGSQRKGSMYLRGGRGRPRAFTNGRRRLSLSRLFPRLCRVTLPAACAQVHPCTSLPFVLWALVLVVVVWSTSIFSNSSSCKRARLRTIIAIRRSPAERFLRCRRRRPPRSGRCTGRL